MDNIRTLLSSGADINAMRVSVDNKAAAPLHYACHYGQFEAAKLLIELKADPALKSSSGDTPFDKIRKAHPQQQAKFATLFGGRLGAETASTNSASQVKKKKSKR